MSENAIARYLNALGDDDARAALTRCCGSRDWGRQMLARRPFADDAALLEASDDIWYGLSTDDWLEAFRHHPRIGARTLDAAPDETARDWSRKEQGTMDAATAATREALAKGNEEYEHRFGHVFLICATGLEPEQMLASLEERLRNSPELELAIAAEEQRKIARLRMRKLVNA